MHQPIRFSGRRMAASRKGVAAVELALCVPLLLTLTMGMVETGNVISTQTRMYSAAYEAARLATRPTTAENRAATSGAVIAYAESLLNQLGISGAQVTLQPADLSTLVPQQLVTVTITAPLGQNSYTSLVVSNAQNLTAQAALVVE